MQDPGREGRTIRKTILVAEDEPIVLKTISSIIQSMGYRVVAAMDGLQAEELFTRHAPELALMVVEIALPNVSGYTFVERLPRLAPRIPVLFTTVMGEYELPDAVRGQFPVLQKPFRADTMIAEVKALVQSI